MVTREEILKIARLAKLSVAEELTAAMGRILAFADTINAAGEGVADFDNVHDLSNAFREDTVVPSYPQAEILRNANGGEDGFFCVRKRQ